MRLIRLMLIILGLGLAVSVAGEEPGVQATKETTTKETQEPAGPAAPAAAASPSPEAESPAADMPPAFSVRRIDFGLQGVETDTSSSRFQEYRDVPNGIVIPFARFAGDSKFPYDVVAENVLQRDARYRLRLQPGSFGIEAEYIKIPHRFGNDGVTLLEDTGPGVLSISPTLRRTFQAEIERQFALNKAGVTYAFLSSLVNPSLAAQTPIDIALLRERGQVEVRLTRDKPYDVRLSYFQEHRKGTRAAGTSFGFGNVVESPEPIDYRTRDFGATAEWTRKSLLLRGSFHYNDFANKNPFENFDNPFRATDSTDPSAYTGPASGSIGGPAFGRESLAPDNKAVTGSAGFLVKFAKRSRLSADVTLGQWTQNEDFMPFTTNTVITTPVRATELSALPARSLDGKVRTFSFSSAFTTRPIEHLTLTARLRRYDLRNDTPRIAFPLGYVRFDAVWEDIPRISVPYGHTTDALLASAAYDLGKLNLEAGYRYDKWDRTFRETESTTQNLGFFKADVRPNDWLVVRGSIEKGGRGFRGLEIERSEDASFLEPGAPANLFAAPSATLCPGGSICNLRFDQSKRDTDRYGAFVELSPGGKIGATLSYIKGKDRYTESLFGLLRADNEALSAEVDYTPRDRINLFGFYTRENISTFQRGRQSGATVSLSALDDWTSEITDKVDSFGGGTTLGLLKEKVDLVLSGSYQRVDGNNDFSSPVGGAPELARRTTGGITDIPFFDDTKIYTVSAELAYHVTKAFRIGLGGWYEQYRLRDLGSNDITEGIVLTNYVPGSFFLAANDSDYKAHVVYLRASYLW
jgi:MtrB/PioB family decaheme-associated outer membrane protein